MKLKQFQEMMKHAQAMQDEIESQMNELRFEGIAGGGLVRVVMDGKKRVEAVEIDPQAVDPEDAELLQDLIIKAFKGAAERVDEKLSDEMNGLTAGLLG